MNFEIDELQQIAQRLDRFMETFGNSRALAEAAELISRELEARDTCITVITVVGTQHVAVRHRRSTPEAEVEDAALTYAHENDWQWDCEVTGINGDNGCDEDVDISEE